MDQQTRIVIISNAHKANDVRLYHKIGKSLCRVSCVYVIGARGFGSITDSQNDDFSYLTPDNTVKPIRMIAPGTSPIPRLFSLYRQACKLKPDIVICIEPLTMLVGLLLRKKTGCRLVYDAHEYYAAAHAERYSFPFSTIVSSLYFLVEKALQGKMDLTMTVNTDIFRLYHLRDVAEGGQGIILPNYPTIEIWKESSTQSEIGSLLPDIEFDTIYLGGLSEARGIMKLLQVVDVLHHKYPQFKALFVGRFITEEFKAKFFDFVMDNNLNSHVFWRDAVPPDKVAVIMKQVKIGLSVLHPRYKRYNKALPLKVLEYLAAGVPVVANDFAQLQPIIAKNHLGYCVSFHKKDIAEAISKLLDLDIEHRKQLSTDCRKVVREHYMWDSVEPVLLSAIQSLISRYAEIKPVK